MTGPRVSTALLAGVLVSGAALYAAAGVGQAYLAADDFQWLMTGESFTWASLFDLSGERFYRPLVDVWFAGAYAVCGPSTACYHTANLGLHLVTVSLVFVLALRLFASARVAFWGALFFALQPSYTEAVVWISGVTTLLATSLFVASLVAQAWSWHAGPGGRGRLEAAAVVAAVGALLSHEAAITLPIISWVMWRQFGPEPLVRRRGLTVGLALAAAMFAGLTVLANHRNPVWSDSHYAIGTHMVRHGVDYLVDLHVGPSWWLAWILYGAAMAAALVATPATRFGAIWLLVTVVPYTGFTWGNVSRYHYLPSIGFSLCLAAALAGFERWLVRRHERRQRVIAAAAFLVAAFVAVRFAKFASPSIESYVRLMEPWRTYAAELSDRAPAPVGGVVHIGPSFARDFVLPIYVAPMLRWHRQEFTLQVSVDQPWTIRQ